MEDNPYIWCQHQNLRATRIRNLPDKELIQLADVYENPTCLQQDFDALETQHDVLQYQHKELKTKLEQKEQHIQELETLLKELVVASTAQQQYLPPVCTFPYYPLPMPSFYHPFANPLAVASKCGIPMQQGLYSGPFASQPIFQCGPRTVVGSSRSPKRARVEVDRIPADEPHE